MVPSASLSLSVCCDMKGWLIPASRAARLPVSGSATVMKVPSYWMGMCTGMIAPVSALPGNEDKGAEPLAVGGAIYRSDRRAAELAAVRRPRRAGTAARHPATRSHGHHPLALLLEDSVTMGLESFRARRERNCFTANSDRTLGLIRFESRLARNPDETQDYMAERFRNEAGSARHMPERTASTILEHHRLSKRFRWVVAAAILTGA